MQIYTQIQQTTKTNKSQINNIEQLYKTLLPRRRFQSHNLTQRQCLALVYEHMRAPLNKLITQIQSNLAHQAVDDDDIVGEQENKQIQAQEQQQQYKQQQDQQQSQQQQEQQPQQLEQQYQQQQMQQQQQQQYENQQQQNEQQNAEHSEDDVGLYGQQIDEEDMESYENQQMDDDPEFGNFNLNKIQQRNKFIQNKNKNKNGENAQDQQDDRQDQYIQDNFDQFREIQRENQEKRQQEQPTELDKQIQRYEDKAFEKKNWFLTGQVKAKQRPVNSLLDVDLEFKSGLKFKQQINEAYNQNLESIIQQRILDEIYDDRVRNIPTSFTKGNTLENVSTEKSNKGLAQLYQLQFKNSLGLGDNKNQKLKKQIMDSLKQINQYLDSLTNTGFSLKPKAKIQKGGSEAIILQDKVPVTNWNGDIEPAKMKGNFESQKQINKKTVRLRNKRNARQRKKEQDRKKMNKAIEYGGMTKIEAEARKKISKSKQNAPNIKYNKSNSFFKNINDKVKAGKPNPNISKLKI